MLYPVLLVLLGCVAAVRPDPARTPVRLLETPTGNCSCVATGPRQAYTAAHCLGPDLHVDGLLVTGKQVGPDLAVLDGRFLPPYASVSPRVTAGLWVEGFGCTGRDEARPALLVAFMPGSAAYSGLELSYRGHVCKGDSGGAIWSTDGLAGVITAYATKDPSLGFGTPVP